METLLPVGVAVVALVLTYFTCVRPMRRGHCMMVPPGREPVEDPALSQEIAQLRGEIAALRGGDHRQHGPGSSPGPEG